MFDRLEDIEKEFEDITAKLSDPELIKNRALFTKLSRHHSELEPIVKEYRKYKEYREGLNEAKALLKETNDRELKQLAEDEIAEYRLKLKESEENLKLLLLPKDPNDEKNVILEIRAGTGGEEAALFASEVFRMYSRYAERKGWKIEVMEIHQTGVGGIKEVVAMIEGKGAYSRLKYESGVHRVQRVPQTESGGRIHTSAVTVAILPEVDEVEVHIDEKDLRIDTFRASGAGGQHVNTTDSAIRITHLPTGLVVTCHDERSQLKNKEKAMKVLRSRLYEMEKERQMKEVAQDRKSQVGSGDRSEKIRTYNFPQSRVTDHRIGKTIYQLQQFLDGEIDEMIDALIAYYQAEALKSLQES